MPVPCESGYVKTRRYKQDAKDKAFRRGAYSNVRDPRKTQSDKVLRSRYAFRPNKPIKVTVKTRKRVTDCARSRKVHRSDFTLQGHPQKCPQEIFGEEEKPQGGLGGQASLVCLPASARFDEVRTQDAPLYHVSPNQTNKSTVKTRRYKQDAKGADFAPRVYLNRGIPKNVRRRFLGKRRSRRAGLADRLRLSACRLPRASTR